MSAAVRETERAWRLRAMREGDLDAVMAVAEDLRAAVQALPPIDGNADGPAVTSSVGAVSRVPVSPACADVLLTLADGALYLAKANGRNRVEAATP